MYRATKDIVLPTTITGSLPRPSWFTENLGMRSFLDAMVNNHFREQYVDAVSVYIHEQELAGLDILTDGDAHFDSDVGGQSWTNYPPRHMGGFDRHPQPTPAGKGGLGFPPGHILHDYLEARVMPGIDGPVTRGDLQYAAMWKTAQRLTKKPMKFGTIGPELGQDSIDAGKIAGAVGFAAVVLYMIASYGWFGAMASFALVINIAGLMALLSLLGATLTLPGIAGIVLTMGMAVDANVLIYERIREELRLGKGPARSVELGFEKAFSAIMDSNVTAIITAVIMFWIGSGPVRGFAVTLGFGILTSMFTAVYVTRLVIATWMAWRRPKSIVV